MIRYSISGTLADKRRIISYLRDRKVSHELIKLGKEKFAESPRGGYTAIYRVAPRKGDGAPMALLKILVDRKPMETKKSKAPKHEVIEAVESAPEPAKKTPEKAKELKEVPIEETADFVDSEEKPKDTVS